MEDFGFDVSGILTPEEAEKIFEEKKNEPEPAQQEQPGASTEQNAEENHDNEEPGRVGVEGGNQDVAQEPEGGSSPDNVYSSIVGALVKDGILPDLEDSDIQKVTTPEAFAELFEKAKLAGLDEAQKRVYDALNNGMNPDEIRQYEQTNEYLDGISDDDLNAEGEEGDNLRKHLIYNDLINRGYTEDKAKKEIQKSFTAGLDKEDAKDALEALRKFYRDGYKAKQEEAKRKADEVRASQKKQADDFKKMILEDDIKLGETTLSKKVCERIYDAVSRPVYKDKETGKLLTAVQKFQKENPLEFLKQLGMWYVLTDGGKNIEGFAKEQAVAEKNKNIKELERKINSSSFNGDGSLSYAGGLRGNGNDPLLSDDWKIG